MKLKSIILPLLAAMSLTMACREELPMLADSISLDTETLTFDSKPSSQQIVFNSSTDWTATVDQDWVQLSHNSGKSNTRSITVTVTENTADDSRQATVTISSVLSNEVSATVTIVQRGLSDAFDGHIRSVENFMEFLAKAPGMVAGDVVELEADLDFAGATIDPIISFAGEFKGNGHKLSNFKVVSKNAEAGLILQNNGTVSNLLVGTTDGKKWDGSTEIKFAAEITGISAGFIAKNAGTVDGVKNFAKVDFNASASVADAAVAGVVGSIVKVEGITGIVKNCENYGTISFTGVIEARACIAGVLGYSNLNGFTIENCTNYGLIAKTNANQKEFTMGGVVGRANDKMYVKSCVNNGSVTYDFIPTEADKINYIHIAGVMGAAYKSCELSDCINKGDVTANILQANRMGGILGTGNTGVIISRCTNEGKITINQASNNNWQAAAGILGFEEKGSASAPVKIIDCVNKGNVQLTLQNSNTHRNLVSAAGIIGHPVSVCILEGNKNEGNISIVNTGSAACYAGGITGFYNYGTVGVESTGNTNSGAISVDAQSGAAGGILGCSSLASVLKEETNTGAITCSTASATGSIAGSTLGSITSCAVGGTVNNTVVNEGNYASLIQGSSSTATVTGCYLYGGAAPSSYISLNPSSLEVAFGGEEKTVSIDSNCEWTASSSADWITLSAAEGNAEVNSLTLTVAANSGEARTATVTLVCKTDAEVKAVVNVSQAAYIAGLVDNKVTSAADYKKFISLAEGATAEDVYTLESDITISAEDFAPIPSFAGTFDGLNHTITVNVSKEDIAKLALFQKVTGTIKNLKLVGSMSSTYAGTGEHGIAGIAFSVEGGHIDNCSNAAVLTLNSTTTGSYAYLAGIVAHLKLDGATVKNCANTGKLTLTNTAQTILGGVLAYGVTDSSAPTLSIKSCTNSADIYVEQSGGNWNYFGGVVGKMGASSNPFTMFTISNCTFSGKMTIAKAAKVRGGGVFGSCGVSTNYLVDQCSMTGTIEVTSTEAVDRLFAGVGPGFSEAGAIGTVSNCVFDGTINIKGGNIYTAGIYGGNGSASVVVDGCKTTSRSSIGGYTTVKSVGVIAARPNAAGFTVKNCKVAGSVVATDGTNIVISADNLADWMYKGSGTTVNVTIQDCGFNAE